MEIAPNVHCVTVGAGHNNVFLVVGERAAFIDSGHDVDEEVEALLECWESVGKPQVAAIVLTHRHGDHIGGANRLAGATRGEILSSPVEKPYIEEAGTRVGRTVADGEVLDLGGMVLEFIHTPGHTLGSLCVFHREQAMLFTGDTVLGSGTTSVNPEQGDMGLYLTSLRRLLALDARTIGPGHGPLIDKPGAHIQGAIERRMERERQILGLLHAGKSTVDELFDVIYKDLEGRLHQTARRQIRAHLIKLEREGKVVPIEGSGTRYAPAAARGR